MEVQIKYATVKSGWPIVYIEGFQVIISKNITFLSLRIDFVLANSAHPDEIPHYAAFHLGLHYLPKYTFRGFWSLKKERIYTIVLGMANISINHNSPWRPSGGAVWPRFIITRFSD